MPRILLFITIIIIISPLKAKEIHAVKFNDLPKLDGILSETVWSKTDSSTGFFQLEPHKGQSSTQPTFVYVYQNDENLYVGIKCIQQNPSIVTAKITARDQIENSDDAFLILIDTFNDQRTGFAFWVNPLGTQTDLYITDDGRNTDKNWDTEWQAAAAITEFGWSAEIIIPFNRISYDDQLDTWGINFARIIRSNSETAYWSGEMNDNYRLSQSGKLTNLQLPSKDSTLRLTPYTTLRFENSDLTGKHNQWLGDIGLDASYQISSGVRVDATINPDFATVEGDQEQLNLTRWELSFPEKRLFFLEGNALFSTRIKTFYSRRIGDIDYGGKTTGKIDDYAFAALATRTAEDTSLGLPSAWFSAVRLKKDILKSSSIGITAVDKSWNDGYTRSLSADVMLNPGTNWKITGQFVTSAPGLTMQHSAWFMRVAHESNLHHLHIRYSDTGDKFKDNVNQTGFIRDDDMREVDSDLGYVFWLKESILKYIFVESRNNVFWSHRGTLRSWYLTPSVRFYFTNKFSLNVLYNNEFKLYEKKYFNHIYNLRLGYNTDEWESLQLDYKWGHNFDREFKLYEFEVQQRFIEQLALKYSFQNLEFNPDPGSDSRILHIVTLDYNFTRDLWLRLLAQTNSSDDRFYIYGLFGWRFLPPFSSIYLIYTTDQFNELEYNNKIKNDILFLKLSYQFGI